MNRMLTQLTPHPCKTGNAVGMPCNETISKPKMSFVVMATILKWKTGKGNVSYENKLQKAKTRL